MLCSGPKRAANSVSCCYSPHLGYFYKLLDYVFLIFSTPEHLGWPFWTLLDPFGPLWNVDKPAMFGHFWSKMDHFWRLPAMDLWLNGPKMAWILDLTWVKYIQVEWAPFLSINASLTVKSLKIMPKMAQTMAIFRHKWLIKWPKKIILINIQLLMSSGQFLIPIKYLEVPLSPAWFIVWPALWNRPAPLGAMVSDGFDFKKCT